MSLRAARTIEIPGSLGSAFDHQAFESEARRVPVAHTARHSLKINAWHSLHFKSASYDGRQLFGVDGSAFTNAGKIGHRTKADSATLFDQVT